MIVLDMQQGSPAWFAARLGLPTASNFDRLITKTGKPSTSIEKYMHELLAAHFIGEPIETGGSAFMERGVAMEQSARDWYEFTTGATPRQVGLCLRDDRAVGCSPDALVGDDGLLEIKCPSAHVHVGNLLGGTDDYKQQMQGCLWITGRRWVDFLSFNPVMPSALVRFQRDEPYIAALAAAAEGLIRDLAAARKRLVGMGCTTPPVAEPEDDLPDLKDELRVDDYDSAQLNGDLDAARSDI